MLYVLQTCYIYIHNYIMQMTLTNIKHFILLYELNPKYKLLPNITHFIIVLLYISIYYKELFDVT